MNFFTFKQQTTFSVLFAFCAMLFSFSAGAQCNNVTSGGSISGNQTINSGETPTLLQGVAPAAGGVGTVEYLWMFNTVDANQSTNLWTAIPGATGQDYQPGALTETTYFIRCARNSGCTEYARESNIITVVVEGGLPVELTDFNAQVKGQDVQLSWATEGEYNHDYFLVEHSTDAVNYAEIGMLEGDGRNSDETRTYSFTHNHAKAGVHYYRLRQTDTDGAFEYSFVVRTQVYADRALAIAPNPAFDLMTIKVSELPQSAAVLTLYSAQTGQQVRLIEVNAGESAYRVDTSGLAPGMYSAQLLSATGERLAAAKFMKAGR